MDKFEYRPATFGADVVNMDGDNGFVGTAEKVRSRVWARELGKSDLLSAARVAREVEVDFKCDYSVADKLRECADADVLNMTPGTFVAQGEWHQRGYILESNVKGVHFGWLNTSLTVALLDGAWWRLRSQSFAPSSGPASDYGYLDYPMDFPYDYSQVANVAHAQVGGLLPCKPRIIFYGPVTDPYIIISGNRYQVTGSVPDGARVEIDGRAKTVIKVLQDGTTTNEFANALRGSGEGGGEYIFQPIPAGDNSVTWDGTFGVDIGWYQEVSEPTWSQS